MDCWSPSLLGLGGALGQLVLFYRPPVKPRLTSTPDLSQLGEYGRPLPVFSSTATRPPR